MVGRCCIVSFVWECVGVSPQFVCCWAVSAKTSFRSTLPSRLCDNYKEHDRKDVVLLLSDVVRREVLWACTCDVKRDDVHDLK
jgi:hypothetical protein